MTLDECAADLRAKKKSVEALDEQHAELNKQQLDLREQSTTARKELELAEQAVLAAALVQPSPEPAPEPT